MRVKSRRRDNPRPLYRGTFGTPHRSNAARKIRTAIQFGPTTDQVDWTTSLITSTIKHNRMSLNETYSRVLIDQALKESGWDLLDLRQVRFELHTATGRADYVLFGPHGPLCVLEAKREDADPYDAKEQGKGYAENMRAPFVLLSNGREHWFWNYERAT